MPKNLAVITVHGMGKTDFYYYEDLKRKLRKYVGKERWDENIHLESVFYQDLMQGRQKDYWDTIDDKYSLKWDFLRKFMLFSFSDAGSIEHSLQTDATLYKNVHRRIADAFDKSFVALGNEVKPVIVVAHSLGCEQVSNYIWDSEHHKRLFAEPQQGSEEEQNFRRFKSCHGLITTGCNIPIFRAGLQERKLFPRPNSNFIWSNYFDDHDVLGYPMRDLSDEFKENWLHDHNVRVGGLRSGWTPASHGDYWTDKDVLTPISDKIKQLL